MAGVQRGITTELRYSTDYEYSGDHDEATWIDIPVGKVRQEASTPPVEEPQTQAMLNGQNALAAVQNSFAYPVLNADGDTFLNAAKSASSELTPVWLWVRQQGQKARIIGGPNGCLVTVAAAAAAAYGNFGVTIFAGMATGADAGDTFEIIEDAEPEV